MQVWVTALSLELFSDGQDTITGLLVVWLVLKYWSRLEVQGL